MLLPNRAKNVHKTAMDPQRLTDLAERFALIIEGLVQAISARQDRVGGWLFFFVPNRFRLLGQELAEFAALIRSGKLFVLGPCAAASGETWSPSSSTGRAFTCSPRPRAAGR